LVHLEIEVENRSVGIVEKIEVEIPIFVIVEKRSMGSIALIGYAVFLRFLLKSQSIASLVDEQFVLLIISCYVS